MPIPKDKEKMYGRIVGHLINLGFSPGEAKGKADSLVARHKMPSDKKLRNKK